MISTNTVYRSAPGSRAALPGPRAARPVAVVAALVWAGLGVAPVWAQSGYVEPANARMEVSIGPPQEVDQTRDYHHDGLTNGMVHLALTRGAGAHGLLALATVQTGAGFVRTSATAEASTDNWTTDSQAFSRGVFADSISIDAPGLTGQMGSVNLEVAVDGELWNHHFLAGDAPEPFLVSEAAVLTYFVAESSVGVAMDDAGYGFRQVNTTMEYQDPVPVGGYTLALTAQFVYGEAFNFSFMMESQANAFVQTTNPPEQMAGQVVAWSDFSHTATWQGLSDLRDSQGNRVTDYWLSSTSGADYRQAISAPPIPEPETWLMWLGGLALLGVRGRRGARQPH